MLDVMWETAHPLPGTAASPSLPLNAATLLLQLGLGLFWGWYQAWLGLL